MWLPLLRAFIIHPDSHESSVAPSWTKGTRGLQRAALSAVQLEKRSLGKRTQQGRWFWLSRQGVRCPQWQSDVCDTWGQNSFVLNLVASIVSVPIHSDVCRLNLGQYLPEVWMLAIFHLNGVYIHLLQSCMRIFFSGGVVWTTCWVSSSVIHTCWCQINFYLSTAEGRWGPFAGLGDGGNACPQLALEIQLLSGFLAFKLNV